MDDFAALIPDARCTTLCCAIIDLTTAQIRYSSAGHPPSLGSTSTLIATITGTATPGAVEVIVSDRGRGLPQMKLLMDDVTVNAGEAGTIVRLWKGLR